MLFRSHSGLKLDYAMDSPEDIANTIKAKRDFALQGGILISNPIPEEYALDPEVMNKNIDEALKEAKALGIHGKETTPFLLKKIVELTGGKSLEANIHLVYNNAKVGAQIAKAYCALLRK